jgi:hypothetical protein
MWLTINDEQVNSGKIRKAVIGPVKIFQYSRGRTDYYTTFGNGLTVTMKDGREFKSGDTSATENIRELERAGFIRINDDVLINPDNIKTAFNGAVRIFQYSSGRTDYYSTYGNGLTIETDDGDVFKSGDESANENRRKLRALGMKI